MVRVDFDLKEFQRVLFQVKAFEHAAPDYVQMLKPPTISKPLFSKECRPSKYGLSCRLVYTRLR